MSTATSSLAEIINLVDYPLHSAELQDACKTTLDASGALVLHDFLTPQAIESITKDGLDNQALAYYTANQHNVYLAEAEPTLPPSHPRNRLVTSSKGCITTDQIPLESALHELYGAAPFRNFLCTVLGESELYEYADSLSSINLHYASEGQELGWHFDNSSFAITLLVQKPEAGAEFEYVKDVRDADANEMNYPDVEAILDDRAKVSTLNLEPGTLVLFRGRNSLHRVTPTIGNTTRMLVVLAYNAEPNVSLSPAARMTFYGRL